MDIQVTRKQAATQGLKLYYTGKPCVHGHVAYRRVSNLTCEECNRIKARRVREESPDLARERNRKDYNRNKEKRIQTVMSWRNQNPDKVKGYSHNCQKKRSAAITAPIAKLHGQAIREIYSFVPEGHEVDHYIPLNHPEVCGLHVPWNLRHLPEKENREKGNKLL